MNIFIKGENPSSYHFIHFMKPIYAYLLLFITIISIQLRFDRIAERSLWFDEITELNNIASIRQGYGLVGGNQGRIVTRGYYFILNLLKLPEYNEFNIRLPAAIFGILAVPLIFFLGNIIFERKTGILSSFLLSISTFHIAYSQEARPYSMLLFFSMLTYLCAYNALTQNSIMWWMCFILSTLLNTYTHYAAFYVLVSEIIFIVIYTSFHFQKNRKTYLKYSVILFISFLLVLIALKPVIIKAIYFITAPQLRNRGIPGLMLNYMFFYKIFGYFSSFSMTYGCGKLLYFLYIFLFLLGILGSIKSYRMSITGVLTIILASFIMLFTIFKPFTFFDARYFIFLLPFFLILVSRGIIVLSLIFNSLYNKIKTNYSCLFLALLVGILHIPTLVLYHSSEKDDWKSISEYLEKQVAKGDILLKDDNTPCIRHYLSFKTKQIITFSNKFNEDCSNNIWCIKYYCHEFNDMFSKMCVLNMKTFNNYLVVRKLKRKDLVKEEDIRNLNFKIESEDQMSKTGFLAIDKDASKKKARLAKKGMEGWLVFGPYVVLPKGGYRVKFRVKVSNNKTRDEVAILNVYKGGDALKTPYVNLKGTDFQKHGQYQDFYLEFDQADGDRQEFRVYSLGKANLWVDYIEVQIISP